MNLAHEYVKLGSTRKAINIYHQISCFANDGNVLPQYRLLLLLRYAQALGTIGDIPKRWSSFVRIPGPCSIMFFFLVLVYIVKL